ncbi:oxidoreductase-like domain-containing protein 1 [Nasonia vitripennis]|uniref:Oxidoreductase-like domain-containing protein n=1 Tax=Nasonia vitripennis TaxID=7425 RepID=A0A7M7PYI3_NASVI|nr:oxidoreductase-like domain-containing protein 1 [Nasonia vitripennis]XP_031778017.1 oxidoreductase-like domain-containing protein 1 [Nasonia vitripennis]
MTKLKHLRPLLLRTKEHYCISRSMSKAPEDDKEGSGNSTTADTQDQKSVRPMYVPEVPLTLEELQEPTTCCMSGCANCVWIEYAEKLSTIMKDSPADVQKLIMEKVQDANMRAFLSMELRVRKIID